ncbi:MAG TPA: hypothetical protein VNP04_25380 [Alphaproteobacteria bacterium]|nr:hypothetical protein [Alphaproteobacteria bacterium]
MGVYHFMGLGRSVGAVTAAVSYLAARYQRYDVNDEEFFALSGEVSQSGKRGDMQALIVFTTPEVREGKPNGLCYEYIANPLGQRHGPTKKDEPMAIALRALLRPDLPILSGGRSTLDMYWCEIERTDLAVAFERVAYVLAAAKPSGEVGKEVWVNLTGGSNIVNMALQLAAALSGKASRLYYLQADENKLARPPLALTDIGTEQDRFWVELPLIYLAFDAKHRAILEELQTLARPITEGDLLSRLKGGPFWQEFQSTEPQRFRRDYLIPLHAQQLLQWQGDNLQIGPRWHAVRQYYDVMTSITAEQPATLAELAKSQPWFHEDPLPLR